MWVSTPATGWYRLIEVSMYITRVHVKLAMLGISLMDRICDVRQCNKYFNKKIQHVYNKLLQPLRKLDANWGSFNTSSHSYVTVGSMHKWLLKRRVPIFNYVSLLGKGHSCWQFKKKVIYTIRASLMDRIRNEVICLTKVKDVSDDIMYAEGLMANRFVLKLQLRQILCGTLCAYDRRTF